MISGLAGRYISGHVQYDCRWRIVVPRQRYVVVAANILGPQGPCGSHVLLSFTLRYRLQLHTYIMHCAGNFSKSPVFFSRSNEVSFSCKSQKLRYQHIPVTLLKFKILFKSTGEQLWTQMTPVLTSRTNGFVTSPGFSLTRSYGPFLDARCNITIPDQHVLMVSFPHFALLPVGTTAGVFSYPSFVSLQTISQTGTAVNQPILMHTGYIPPRLFHSAVLVVRFVSGNSAWDREQRSGMNMTFSLHPLRTAPSMLTTGYFNCSTPHYAAFKQHIHCNLRRECEDGEDEGAHCSFSSPSCNGWIEAGGKCYFSVDLDRRVTWQRAQTECEKRGAVLAMMKTPTEWEAFWKISHIEKNWKRAYVGVLFNQRNLQPLYRHTWMWLDGSPAFDVNITAGHFQEEASFHLRLSAVAEGLRLKSTVIKRRHTDECSRYICQVHYADSQSGIEYTAVSGLRSNISTAAVMELDLIPCPTGHLVRAYLLCDTESRCGTEVAQSHCSASVRDSRLSQTSSLRNNVSAVNIVLFTCANKITSLPYTLVCDFRCDCEDQSDESFCTHSQSCGKNTTYRCQSGQCIPSSQMCDLKADCLDVSDENRCSEHSSRTGYDFIFLHKVSAPFVLTYTQNGKYEQTEIRSSEPCPQQYFRCPSSGNCLPVYLRCNGVHDCLQGEDESACGTYTCAGFFKCRKSTACVHVNHVCDGDAQCPLMDDEAFCDPRCPHNCYCQGFEVVCRSYFDASALPQIRYLDASHSSMTPNDLVANTYLVYVNLASCRIGQIGSLNLPNLQGFDLSWNSIVSIDMDVFISCKQLQSLSLMGNPLTQLTGGRSDEHNDFLNHVDFSQTSLTMFDTEPLQRFFTLKSINISFCRLTTITKKGFQSTPVLRQIDMRGNPIQSYTETVLKELVHLKLVFTSNYKLCCPAMLPDGLDENLCFSPQNELSSCKDLLRSNVYRVSLWLICIASVVGNVGCLCFRNLTTKTQSASGFSVFVSNLSLSDFLMGIYLAFVGVADHIYQGNYYLYEHAWTTSIPCSVSGATSLLSSEVSAVIVCFITLDRFIALRFPFSTLKFSKPSAVAVCVLAWLLGLAMSLAPLCVSHWEFYSQTGICVPLPVTRREFSGHAYSFGIMIIFNFILFLVVAIGQVVIYNSVSMNTMASSTGQKLQDVAIARRLLTVAVSDFLCWFPIGLLGLMAHAGVPVPEEVNVAMAIFILPLNSALNPFLYTFNTLLERRRREKERQLLKYLVTVNDSTPTSTNTSEVSASSRVSELTQRAEEDRASRKGLAMLYLRKALNLRVVSTEQIKTFLFSYDSDK